MRSIPLVFASVLAVGLCACSKGDPTPTAAPSAEPSSAKDSTSLNIDTDKGSVSYDAAKGDNKTSISIGEDQDKDKK
jgi:hypothetical protein